MPIYKIIHHKDNDEIEEYEIEAADLSDAQEIALDSENIKISAMEPVIKGRILDLSHWQAHIDWDKITDLVILKCTESTDYLDPTFKERQKILREKELYLGCYHFFRDVDVIAQADWFLKNADYKPGELLILDFEIDCANPVEKCKQFLDRIGGGWIYTNEARNIKYNLNAQWVAKYPLDDTGVMKTAPKGNWKLWQFSSKGKVDGIVGNVDLNYTPLSLLELAQNIPPSSIPEATSDFNIYISNNYFQRDKRYAGIKLGNSNFSFQNYGCFTCCLAYLVGLDPLVVMKKLIDGGAYDGALIISEIAAKVLGLQYLGKEKDINKRPDWYPSIKEVSLGKSQHFAVRIMDNGVKQIFDPWTGKMQTLNYYPFRSYRLFKK